jgi:hypothetical protein
MPLHAQNGKVLQYRLEGFGETQWLVTQTSSPAFTPYRGSGVHRHNAAVLNKSESSSRAEELIMDITIYWSDIAANEWED